MLKFSKTLAEKIIYRSLSTELALVFGIIVALIVAAGMNVQQGGRDLVESAKNAVWEASVPPAEVFAFTNTLWSIRDQLVELVRGQENVDEGLKQIEQLEQAGQEKWKGMLDLKPYLPAEVLAEVEKTDALLNTYRATYHQIVEAARAGDLATARAINDARIGPAIRPLGAEIFNLLEVMRNRIQSVNDTMVASSTDMLMRVTETFAALLLVLAAGGVLMHFRIVRPVGLINTAMRRLSENQFGQKLPRRGAVLEIWRMTTSFLVLEERAKATLERHEEETRRAAGETAAFLTEVENFATNLADGNLCYKMPEEFAAKFQAVAHNLNRATDSLTMSLGIVLQASHDTTKTAHDIGGRAQANSDRANQQIKTLASLQQSVDEFSANIRQSAAKAEEMARAATDASQRAEQGSELAASALKAMTEITGASKKIGDVATLINKIAAQTNLLALNAAIEAARAGDHGKGFAVVASEVRRLAGQVASASQTVQTIVDDTLTCVEAGSGTVNQTAAALAEIDKTVQEVTLTVQDIAKAAYDQAERMGDITNGFASLNEIAHTNVKGAAVNVSASAGLNETARNIAETIASFRL